MSQVLYNYIFVRTDLPIAQQIVQSSHAAYESALHLGSQKDRVNHLVLFGVKSEEELHKAHHKLESNNINTRLFCEPDIGNQATALCTEQISQPNKKLFSKYNLWKG